MHFALQLCVSSLTHMECMIIRRTTSVLTLSMVCASTGWECDEVWERWAWNRAWPWLMAARHPGFRTPEALLPNQNQRRGSQMTWIFHTDQLKGELSTGVQISDSSLSLIKATMSNEKNNDGIKIWELWMGSRSVVCQHRQCFLNVLQYFLNMVLDLQFEKSQEIAWRKNCFSLRCTQVIAL